MNNVERQQRNTEYVSAAARENLLAGFGAGVLAFVLGFAWGGYSETLLTVALCVAGGFFGFLCMVRFSLDEFKAYYDQENYERTVAGLLAEVDALRKELKHARTESRTAEFAAASKNAKALPAVDDFAQLRADVDEIIARWAASAKYGRDHCSMGRPRWEMASRVLVDCGAMVIEESGRKARVFREGISYAEVDKRVRVAFARMREHKDTNFTPALS